MAVRRTDPCGRAARVLEVAGGFVYPLRSCRVTRQQQQGTR